MALFGGKPRTGGFGEVYPAPAQSAPRRSVFGRLGNWARTRDWERVGASLRDDPGVLSDLMAGRRQEQMMAAQMGRENTEDKQRSQQQAQLEQLIATLPPEMQAAARLNPQAVVEHMLRQQGQNQWQTDGTRPYRIGPNGEVIEGSGTIPFRPRAPLIQYGGGAGIEDDGIYSNNPPPGAR